MVAVSVGLSACSVPDWANPVEWYRDTTGVAQDDPKPDARNTQNLEKGGEQPYPNLASVPPPPNNALSAADREKLRNSLAADRANAKYVEGNDQYVAAPPKVVPSPPLNAPEPAAQPETAAAPAAAVQATPVPAAPPQTAAPAESTQATPVPAPAKSPPAASPAPGRGTEKPPQESSLTPPSVRSLPQGETPRPAPPPPRGVPVSAQPQSPPASQPPPAAPQLHPPQTAALPPPSLRPPAGGGAGLPLGVGETLGTVTFTGNSAKLSPEILAQVREVAALHQQNGGGTIRVTGYSEPQGDQDGMAPRLASFNLALDRARAVAAALTQNGVPLRSVEIGASPPPPGQAGGVVEMLLEQ
jgi:outer membrane protein OmpA-like peptidoglycan-associated protein